MSESDPETTVLTVGDGVARIRWTAEETLDTVRHQAAAVLTTHHRVEALVDPDDEKGQRTAMTSCSVCSVPNCGPTCGPTVWTTGWMTGCCGSRCAHPVGNRPVLWTTTRRWWHNLLISYIRVSTRCRG